MATSHPESAEDMQGVMTRLDRVDSRIETLTIQVTNFGASIMSRAEITAADDRRVPIESFNAHVATDEMRFARLENGPQRMLGWIALAVSGGLGCLSLIVAAVSVLVSIWLASKP